MQYIYFFNLLIFKNNFFLDLLEFFLFSVCPNFNHKVTSEIEDTIKKTCSKKVIKLVNIRK